MAAINKKGLEMSMNTIIIAIIVLIVLILVIIFFTGAMGSISARFASFFGLANEKDVYQNSCENYCSLAGNLKSSVSSFCTTVFKLREKGTNLSKCYKCSGISTPRSADLTDCVNGIAEPLGINCDYIAATDCSNIGK